jgi:hypothetical protein
MSHSVIDRIDQELSSSTVLRSGMSAYAAILRSYERLAKRDRAAADRQLEEAIVDLAARLYRQSSSRNSELLMFSDGANDCLFDATNERTVPMYGRSKTTPPNSRDTPYHQGYPRAGDGYDKGHALSHAQGGLEGGPNYFKQKRSVNQRDPVPAICGATSKPISRRTRVSLHSFAWSTDRARRVRCHSRPNTGYSTGQANSAS